MKSSLCFENQNLIRERRLRIKYVYIISDIMVASLLIYEVDKTVRNTNANM